MQYKKNWKPKRKKYYQFKFESNKDKLRSLYFWVEDFTKNKVIWYPTIFPSLFIKWRFHWRFKKVLKNLVTFKLCFHSMLGMWRDLRESPIGQWHISSVLSGPGAWTAWTLPDCNIWYQPRQTGHWSVLGRPSKKKLRNFGHIGHLCHPTYLVPWYGHEKVLK